MFMRFRVRVRDRARIRDRVEVRVKVSRNKFSIKRPFGQVYYTISYTVFGIFELTKNVP